MGRPYDRQTNHLQMFELEHLADGLETAIRSVGINGFLPQRIALPVHLDLDGP